MTTLGFAVWGFLFVRMPCLLPLRLMFGIFIRKCTLESVSEPTEYNILFTIEMQIAKHTEALS